MKIAIVNTRQSGGGAAIAASRLFEALKGKGIKVRFITAEGKGGDGVTVLSDSLMRRLRYKCAFLFERAGIWLGNKLSRRGLFEVSTARFGMRIANLKEVREADIIHLHWVNQGMLSVREIKRLAASGKQIVVTPHDMWYCTAICHHSFGCMRFTERCCDCRFLASPSDHDLAAKVWEQKEGMFGENTGIVALSEWIKGRIEASAITRGCKCRVIPNPIDCSIYNRNFDKGEVRRKYGILPEARVVIFGAAKLNDPIKGSGMLFNAIERCKYREDITLLLFGNIKDDDDFLERVPCRHVYAGSINDEKERAALYAASDVAAVPSHYETFGQVIAEAMACGTPVLAFDNGGQRDIIEHGKNGYLAAYPDINDLARGLEWLLDNCGEETGRYASESIAGRFSPESVADKHIAFYRELLENRITD